jgi:hypothetical protein
LIEHLRNLAKDTDPSAGVSSQHKKDLRAFRALQTAGELVSALAGWAICHTVGLAKDELSFVPLQPSKTENHPDYLVRRAKADSHKHEAAGSLPIKDPRIARRALINLIKANSGGWPQDLVLQLISALEGLDFGERSPIFEPLKESRKASLTELRHQLKAICFVEYCYKRGTRKLLAIRRVASVFGVGEETVRSWEKRLRDDNALGQLEVSSSIAFAHNAASNDDEEGNKLIYGDLTMISAGREYVAFKKAQKRSIKPV